MRSGTCTISIPTTRCRSSDEMLEIDRWILARAEDLVRRAARLLRRECVSQSVSRDLRFRDDGFERGVFRCAQGPALHGSDEGPRAAQRADGAVQGPLRADAAAAPLLAFTTEEVWSYTRKPAGAPDSVHLALLPEPEELASGLDAAKLARWERLLEVRGVVLKALEEARQAKFIGTSLEARVRLAGAQLGRLRGRLARSVHRFASGAGTGQRIEGHGRARRGRQVRALLEVLRVHGPGVRFVRRRVEGNAGMNLRVRSAIIAFAVVMLDRLSKVYIRRSYAPWDVTVVIPRVFNIVHAENPGAAFSMLADAPPLVRAVLLVGVSVVVMTGVGVMLWRPAQE